jgi:hypothetical protein
VSNKGVSERGGTTERKKGLKVNGTTVIRMKRGMQWTRLQIRVLTGPNFYFILFYITPAELYSNLNNTTVTKWPNV